ncbi:COG2958 family protein [Bartonella raoultii]|uniref:HrgA protein n=1 Tax=Bartonella raoultii TaxID=1457020 RepID=A0ABS7I7Y8_9HYPH|nr:HrgA protein [Bartonella raoultii]MBX4335757.1 HrgA protein [Bartonella raoultii]
MTLDLTNTTFNFLKQNPTKKFTAREIAQWIFENYTEACRKKQKRSTAIVTPLNSDTALIQQIVAEIGSKRPHLQKRHPEIKTTEGRPRQYYFTQSTDSDEIDEVENNMLNGVGDGVKECDLYPLLSKFLWSELKVYSKRINEKHSHNRHGYGGNKWLYPDLVGIQDLSEEWHREIKDSVLQYFDKKTKLWSFEVKILINRSNVRQAFFQTVSNSSWANFSYLVASEISGIDTLKELRMLANLHGIGFIRLDKENFSESQIMISAKERNEINWDTANRLLKENKDFYHYIKLIRQFYQTGEIRQSDWDHVS